MVENLSLVVLQLIGVVISILVVVSIVEALIKKRMRSVSLFTTLITLTMVALVLVVIHL